MDVLSDSYLWKLELLRIKGNISYPFWLSCRWTTCLADPEYGGKRRAYLGVLIALGISIPVVNSIPPFWLYGCMSWAYGVVRIYFTYILLLHGDHSSLPSKDLTRSTSAVLPSHSLGLHSSHVVCFSAFNMCQLCLQSGSSHVMVLVCGVCLRGAYSYGSHNINTIF